MLPTPTDLAVDDKALLLVRKAYWSYIQDLNSRLNCDPMVGDLTAISHVNFDDFQTDKYLDCSNMKRLLNESDYLLWKEVMRKE